MKPIIHIVASALALAFLSACSTTSGRKPEITYSKFDGSRTVSISPHGTYCAMTLPCLGIGAEWTSDNPQSALLEVKVWGAYVGIEQARLNIDGSIVDLSPSQAITNFTNPTGMQRESDRYFRTTIDQVRRIAKARHVVIQVGTLSTTLENVIIDGTTDSKAYYAMQRFVAMVDKAPAAPK